MLYNGCYHFICWDLKSIHVSKRCTRSITAVAREQLVLAWERDGASLIARFMGPTWGPSRADRTQVGPMLAPWNLQSGMYFSFSTKTWVELWSCRHFVDTSERLRQSIYRVSSNMLDVRNTWKHATPFDNVSRTLLIVLRLGAPLLTWIDLNPGRNK